MTLKSIIDPKKKAQVLQALKRNDPSLLSTKKRKPEPDTALVRTKEEVVPSPMEKTIASDQTSDNLGKRRKLTECEKKSVDKALLEAAERGSMPSVLHFFRKGAGFISTDEDGCTPLMIAAGKGHIEIVKFIVENVESLEEECDEKQTALIKAARWGHFNTVELLLKSGAKVNATSKSMMTALDFAEINKHHNVVDLLKK
jgi:ankyrin repeat protein